MSSRPHLPSRAHLDQWLVCFVPFTLPAVAQLDSATLRAKYGVPLNRETFRMPTGFDLVVDYGLNNQACKLQVPALMPTNPSEVSDASVMKQRMYAFLAELVPDSMRGKLIRGFSMSAGLTVLLFEYEHVTVSELQAGDPFSHDNVITVSFTDTCKSVNVR